MLKINQSTFIRDLLEEENLIKYNLVNIQMKANSIIDISKVKNYKEATLKAYQRLIKKFIYILYGTKPDITFDI